MAQELISRRRRRRERGIALITVLFGAAMILLLLLTMLSMTSLSGRIVAKQLTYNGQAINAAQAGINESLSWFVHQKQQPVVQFNPQLDPGGVCAHVPAHVPPVNETDDPTTGIVRTYQVASAGVYGRYTVDKTKVLDVSKRRGKPQDGTIWRIESEGTIYVRNDAAKPPTTAPNVVLAHATMRAEVQRLGLQLPANAALNSVRADNVNVTKAGRVQGGSAGIGVAYPASTGSIKGKGTVTGNPAQNTTSQSFQLAGVFGVTQQELIAMADVVVDDEKQLPDPLPSMALIVIKGNATFNPQKKLNGSGILVVLGNLILNPQSDTFFSGVIWVGGQFNMSPPGSINGSVVALGNATLSGGSDVSEINYDAAILDQLRLQMGNYLFSRSPWITGINGG
jgi:Tfp pilus assembly protein PilX